MRPKTQIKKVISLLEKAVVSDILVYDMKNLTPFYDYTIICSVNSNRQGNAAVNYLRKDAEKCELSVRGYHAGEDTKWFLVDLNSIIAHIFVGDERERYNLDGMYGMQNLLK